jgi:hypothetical protein
MHFTWIRGLALAYASSLKGSHRNVAFYFILLELYLSVQTTLRHADAFRRA